MEIKSLNKLKKNDNTYDLYHSVIINDIQYNIFEFILERKHIMRIDKVCQDIYDSVDYIDILCKINNIINPLSINENDIIYFIDDTEIDNLQNNDDIISEIKQNLSQLNKGKQFKQDNNRQTDLLKRKQTEQQKQLPSNLLNSGQTNINKKDGNIILKPNF